LQENNDQKKVTAKQDIDKLLGKTEKKKKKRITESPERIIPNIDIIEKTTLLPLSSLVKNVLPEIKQAETESDKEVSTDSN
jgi:vacuolar-type H+-ATPase subunit H